MFTASVMSFNLQNDHDLLGDRLGGSGPPREKGKPAPDVAKVLRAGRPSLVSRPG